MKASDFAKKTVQLVFASSTKISSIFFAGVAVTVAGGLVTALTHSGPASSVSISDERFPASAQEAAAEDANRPGRSLLTPPIPANIYGGSRPGSEAAADMASQLARAAEERAPQTANAPPAEPIAITNDLASEAAPVRANPSQDLIPGDDRPTGTSTSTGTSTGTEPNTNGFGASVNSNSSTDTSTATATTPDLNPAGPSNVQLATSDTGWAGVCQSAVVSLVDLFGNPAGAPYPMLITLGADTGSFYSDAGCATAAISVSLNSGVASATAYFKASATANVTASEPSLAEADATVTIAMPAATIALGQPDLTSHAAAAAGLSAPNGVLRVNGKLVVADGSNNRVLIWNSIPTSGTQPADIVLGQPNLTTVTSNTGGTSAISLSNPTALASDGTRLVVADTGNSRVLIWDLFPATPRAAASHVVGQATMAGGTANRGGIPAGNTLSSPSCVVLSSGALFVCDKANNRVLGWPSIPTMDSVSASFAVGQPDLATVSSGHSAAKLDTPTDALVANGQLYVSDSANDRVLAWATVPSSSNSSAILAIGQPDTATNGAGATSATSLSAPSRVRVDAQGRLLISDPGNHRVLLWNQAPTASGLAADGVIGQPSFAGNSSGSTASSLDAPTGVEVLGTELWISDTGNNRVVGFNLP